MRSFGGFRIEITKEQVERAPHYSRDQEIDWGSGQGRRIYDHGVPAYWA